MRLAFFVHPNPYGLYTVFRHLRRGLAQQGIELCWVGSGAQAMSIAADPAWRNELQYGQSVPSDPADEAQQGRDLVNHLESGGYDGVIINPPQFPVQLNVARYLAKRIIRVMVVHSTALGAYRAARGIRDFVDATIGVSVRAHDDLVAGYGFAPDRTHVVPHALDEVEFAAAARSPAGPVLRLLSFGRIEQTAKGVFWLPEIMRKLAGVRVTLTIAGEGPDLPALRRRCEPLGELVRFVGLVPAAAIPQLVADHDVFIMPSRTEGFGYTIIEAMAGGCVPVVSRIRGVSDTIVRDGRTGRLFKIGDTTAAAAAIRALAEDRTMLADFSRAAREDCLQRFTARRMGEAYAKIIRQVAGGERHLPEPLPLAQWAYPRGFSSGWRAWLPEPLKNLIRAWRSSN